MQYTIADVQQEIKGLTYLLPKREEFTAMLRERKFAPMQIAEQRYADFVSGNLQDYLHYLRICGVRGIMFSFSYYSEEELENLYKLEQNGKTLFAKHSCSAYARTGFVSRYGEQQSSDYQDYVRYSSFICKTVDLTHPKELRLYSVYQGRVFACQMADAWLLRLNLLNRNSLMQLAMDKNLGMGEFPFKFFGFGV